LIKSILHIILFFGSLSLFGQGPYAGPVGTANTDAIHLDSSIISGWANSCSITRGWQNAADTSLGKATVGDSSLALGKALNNGVVSLGDGGVAIVGFDGLIYDGPGPDFAIFENAFSETFLELAFVEVSSDGVHYFRFPSVSLTDTSRQVGGFDTAGVKASNIHNLAGKYIVGYGTPFDLSDLPADSLLDAQAISHVRIIDVVGSMANSLARRDKNGHKINDPFPTPFPSSGFDLDAVGAIHMKAVGLKENSYFGNKSVSIYPNPAQDQLFISGVDQEIIDFEIYSIDGVLRHKGRSTNGYIDLTSLNKGQYILRLIGQDDSQSKAFFKL